MTKKEHDVQINCTPLQRV